jgi:hypothetical protein
MPLIVDNFSPLKPSREALFAQAAVCSAGSASNAGVNPSRLQKSPTSATVPGVVFEVVRSSISVCAPAARLDASTAIPTHCPAL